MADEVKTTVTPAVETVEQKTEEIKTVPYDRFREVNEKAKTLEAKLAEHIATMEAAKKKADEEKAKESGDYQTLIEQTKKEREAEKVQMNKMVKNTYLSALAVKNGILKDEYVKLFDAELQIDNLEIKNASDVEKAFDKFKTENPTLFKGTEKPVVPATDNKPVKKVSTVVTPTLGESGYDAILAALSNK
jgi:hypothetical protein